MPLGCDKEADSVDGPRQGEAAQQQNEEYHIRQQGREEHHLQHTNEVVNTPTKWLSKKASSRVNHFPMCAIDKQIVKGKHLTVNHTYK